jgi:hypothetical protein
MPDIPDRPTIATATQEQLDAALLLYKPCARCKTLFKPKRSWQRFCSDSCRTGHHNEENNPERLREKLQIAKRQELELLAEIEELQAEISRLRAG